MQIDLSKLVASHISKLKPYSSARDEFSGSAKVFLDANENPFGSVGGGHYNRYPDPLQRDLKLKLSTIKNVDPESIFFGNGSDEPIDLLIRAYCEPQKDQILVFPPTYGMYKVAASINNTPVLEIPLTDDFQLNLDKIQSEDLSRVKIAFVCSPNNPTGNSIKVADIMWLLKNFQGLVVVDEAYIDFSPNASFSNELVNHNNLIVLQTFSKAWGLAGIRFGMAFANQEIIKVLNKIKYPYNLNSLTQKEVLRVLDHTEEKDQRVSELNTLKSELKQVLMHLSFVEKIYASEANFLLIKVAEPNRLYSYLIEQGIVTRNRSQVILCEGCIRVTIGQNTENQKLISALKRFEVD